MINLKANVGKLCMVIHHGTKKQQQLPQKAIRKGREPPFIEYIDMTVADSCGHQMFFHYSELDLSNFVGYHGCMNVSASPTHLVAQGFDVEIYNSLPVRLFGEAQKKGKNIYANLVWLSLY